MTKKGLRMTKLGVRMAGREGQNDRHVVTLRRSRRVSCWRGFFPFASLRVRMTKKRTQNDKIRSQNGGKRGAE